MSFIVEMVRGEPHTRSYAFYSCSKSTWEQMLEIGRTFGWVPSGTIPDPGMLKRTVGYMDGFEPTYRPDDWAYAKRVDEVDARSLAEALFRADRSVQEGTFVPKEKASVVLRDDMSIEEALRINNLLSEQILKFAQFAAGGSFVFAWDD